MTPSCLTAAGNCAWAWPTRFCVFTCMMSTSVPTSKRTFSVILPSLALKDCMYSSLSTPLTFDSMGVATDSMTASAAAPR
jgi:hypothetical protein